jgi:hypothetical protein
MRASVIILGFLATLTVALPEALPKVQTACQSVSLCLSNRWGEYVNGRARDDC